jgi:hypothetical protein
MVVYQYYNIRNLKIPWIFQFVIDYYSLSTIGIQLPLILKIYQFVQQKELPSEMMGTLWLFIT